MAVRIFQIGFNKCGTRSLFRFFKNNGLRSVHWGKGAIGLAIHRNVRSGRPPLEGVDEYEFYSDMEGPFGKPLVEGFRYFREIYAYDNDSIFILNTRDVNKWIASRCAHLEGAYLRRHMQYYRLENAADVAYLWRQQWHKHHGEVLEFFADKKDHLILFDLERDNSATLVVALKGRVELKDVGFPHAGKTGGSARQKRTPAAGRDGDISPEQGLSAREAGVRRHDRSAAD